MKTALRQSGLLLSEARSSSFFSRSVIMEEGRSSQHRDTTEHAPNTAAQRTDGLMSSSRACRQNTDTHSHRLKEGS